MANKRRLDKRQRAALKERKARMALHDRPLPHAAVVMRREGEAATPKAKRPGSRQPAIRIDASLPELRIRRMVKRIIRRMG